MTSSARRAYRQVGMLAVAMAVLLGCAAEAGRPPVAAGPPDPAPPLRLLQMNLCNSGIAGCFTGRAVEEGAAVIRAEVPDVITLNEICGDDVAVLERALAEAAPGASTSSHFQPARDRGTGGPYPCRDGGQFGIGVVSQTSSAVASAGIHPAQDPLDPEERAWLCLDTGAGSALTACTTHLAYTDRSVAVAQCRYLFDDVVVELRARDGAGPTVVGADLNLGPGDDPDFLGCLPDGFTDVGDHGRQQVVASPELVAADFRQVDMRGTTDHPAMLVTLDPVTP